jgi:hypothetical protein
MPLRGREEHESEFLPPTRIDEWQRREGTPQDRCRTEKLTEALSHEPALAQLEAERTGGYNMHVVGEPRPSYIGV